MLILTVLVVILSIVVAALCLALWALSRQVGLLFERVLPLGALVTDSGPTVGSSAPEFDLNSISSSEYFHIGGAKTKSTLLFFLSPSCPVCKKLIPILGSIEKAEASWLSIVLASDGDLEQHQQFLAKYKLDRYPYLLSSELGMSFRVSRLPFAVLIDESGKIASKGLVNNREQIESLFNAKELDVPSVQVYLDNA